MNALEFWCLESMLLRFTSRHRVSLVEASILACTALAQSFEAKRLVVVANIANSKMVE
jgi:hypothetical protein